MSFTLSDEKIVALFRKTLQAYDLRCKQGFFERAGREGIARSQQFKHLLDDLTINNAPNFLLHIYNFYINEKPSSRLVRYIELTFLELLKFQVTTEKASNIYSLAKAEHQVSRQLASIISAYSEKSETVLSHTVGY